MTLWFGLRSATDLNGKLQRDAATLKQVITSDNFFNFVVTGYSLIDWVRHESGSPVKRSDAINRFFENRWLKTCGDIATAAKHHTITIRQGVITRNVTTNKGFGI